MLGKAENRLRLLSKPSMGGTPGGWVKDGRTRLSGDFGF